MNRKKMARKFFKSKCKLDKISITNYDNYVIKYDINF